MSSSDDDRLWRAAELLARAARSVSGPDPAFRPPPLLFVTDGDRTPRPWETAARLPPGAGVIYRAFDAPDRVAVGQRLRAVTREGGLLFVVGADPDLAETVEAEGVHLPQRLLPLATELRARRPEWRLTGAAHDAEALRRCAGLDAAVVSPVFAASPGSEPRPALGVRGLKALVAVAPCPAYALGGINADNAAELAEAGVCGLAAASAISRAFGVD